MFDGVDLGSRTVKVAAVRDGELFGFRISESGFDPHRQTLDMMDDFDPVRIVATGAASTWRKKNFAYDVITEIKGILWEFGVITLIAVQSSISEGRISK